MKNTCSFLLWLLIMLSTVQAQTLFSDSFENGSLSSWNTVLLNGTAVTWSASNNLILPTAAAYSGSYAARFGSSSGQTGNAARLILKSALNLSATTIPAVVSFYMYHDNSYPTSRDSLKVRWSSDNGLSWSDGLTGFARTEGTSGWKKHNIILSGTQGSSQVKVCFDGIKGLQYGANIFIDEVRVYIPENMNLVDNTALQTNRQAVRPGSQKVQILDIQITTANELNPVKISEFRFSADGSTAPLTDITRVQLWTNKSHSLASFITADSLVGAEVTAGFAGQFAVTPVVPLTLSEGVNYFWLTYDVAAGAADNNYLDAAYLGVVTFSGLVSGNGNPAGVRLIKSGMSGSYSIDPLGSGNDNYLTFTQAVNDLNALPVNGTLTFNVAAGAVFNEAVPPITATGAADRRIVFQKNGAGDNPVIQSTGTGDNDFGINLQGGDYFAFDGIDIEDKSTNLTAAEQIEYGYYLCNGALTSNNGAQHNVIKNCSITLNRANKNTKCIYSTTGIAAASFAGTNSFNRFYNISADNAYHGIYLTSITGTVNMNEGNEIGADNGGSTLIGQTAGIGGTIASATASGVFAEREKDLIIANTSIKNITSAYFAYGINAASLQGNCFISRNRVNNISVTSSSSMSKSYGIRADVSTSHSVAVYNNMISGVKHGITSANATTVVRGIAVNTLNSNMTGSAEVYHNSVLLATGDAATSRVFESSYGTVALKNNLFINKSQTAGTAKNYAVSKTVNTVLASDYNSLFVTGSNGFIGSYNNEDKVLLTDWQAAAVGLDANSLNFDPVFNASDDLHLQVIDENNPVRAVAPRIAAVLKDIDGEDRSEMTDIGCDEAVTLQVGTTVPSSSQLLQNFPNPFNPVTAITFFNQFEGEVILSVFNAKGELISVPVNSSLSAGQHSYSFDGTNLNSGIYFYRLQTANSTQVRKMLLVK